MTQRQKLLTKFILIVVLALVVGLISYPKVAVKVPPVYNALNKLKINLGLDLQGGIHLEYEADTSQIDSAKIDEAMQAVQDVIERKVNVMGVSEPVIYTTRSGSERRVIVELAGVNDINEAKKQLGEMPFLEFKEEKNEDEMNEANKIFDSINDQSKKKAGDILKKALAGGDFAQLAKENSEDPSNKDSGGDLSFAKKRNPNDPNSAGFVPAFEKVLFDSKFESGKVWPEIVETEFGWHIIKKIEQRGEGENLEIHSAHILFAKRIASMITDLKYKATELTGKNLKDAKADFQNQGLSEPVVALQFDSEGTKLFAELTKKNIGKTIAIYLDGKIVSDTGQGYGVKEEIASGNAVISGNFTVEETKNLARRLREGALPVPIKEIAYNAVGATLAEVSLEKSLKAGLIGLALVIIFMIIYYRFLGVVASVALLIYAGLMIAIFKLSAFSPWQITLTLPGIAGFVLSIGMAVDANILIFERTKEEVRRGRNILNAVDEGFKRAWTSIRDGNVSSIITAMILINLGTGFVKGFAVTLVIGVLVSMFTAVVITRTILRFVMGEWIQGRLWLIGINNAKIKNQNEK